MDTISPLTLRAKAGPPRRSPWPLLIGAPLAAAAAWAAYSALFVNHDLPLPPALPGKKSTLATPVGTVALYAGGPAEGAPLLLAHSVNAAGSAYEVRPLYQHYARSRPVYALDLPGFGFSERRNRVYTPRVMVDALHAVVAEIRARHGGAPVDLAALSLTGEFAARAAVERPGDYRSLGLISPTGFDARLSGEGSGGDRGSALAHSVASLSIWSQPLFDLLVSPPSLRFFLSKAWGSPDVDEGLLAYDYLTTHQPGATHAVWSFLAGYLFPDDATRLYRALTLPVWFVHGVRGDFVDYRYKNEVTRKPNWTHDVFETGAFPHFERLEAVAESYDGFLRGVEAGEPFSRLRDQGKQEGFPEVARSAG